MRSRCRGPRARGRRRSRSGAACPAARSTQSGGGGDSHRKLQKSLRSIIGINVTRIAPTGCPVLLAAGDLAGIFDHRSIASFAGQLQTGTGRLEPPPITQARERLHAVKRPGEKAREPGPVASLQPAKVNRLLNVDVPRRVLVSRVRAAIARCKTWGGAKARRTCRDTRICKRGFAEAGEIADRKGAA